MGELPKSVRLCAHAPFGFIQMEPVRLGLICEFCQGVEVAGEDFYECSYKQSAFVSQYAISDTDFLDFGIW